MQLILLNFSSLHLGRKGTNNYFSKYLHHNENPKVYYSFSVIRVLSRLLQLILPCLWAPYLVTGWYSMLWLPYFLVRCIEDPTTTLFMGFLVCHARWCPVFALTRPSAAGTRTLSPLPYERQLLWGRIIVIMPFGQVSNLCWCIQCLGMIFIFGCRFWWVMDSLVDIKQRTILSRELVPCCDQVPFDTVFFLSFLFWSGAWFKLIIQRVYANFCRPPHMEFTLTPEG